MVQNEVIKKEILKGIESLHHHDVDFSTKEGYHLHEGELFEEEVIKLINEVFARYE